MTESITLLEEHLILLSKLVLKSYFTKKLLIEVEFRKGMEYSCRPA